MPPSSAERSPSSVQPLFWGSLPVKQILCEDAECLLTHYHRCLLFLCISFLFSKNIGTVEADFALQYSEKSKTSREELLLNLPKTISAGVKRGFLQGVLLISGLLRYLAPLHSPLSLFLSSVHLSRGSTSLFSTSSHPFSWLSLHRESLSY